MSKVDYSDSFIQRAQEQLREMVEQNLMEIPYGKPFDNFRVVIGNPENKLVIAVVDIPEDLKDKIGDKKVYVVNI